MKSIRDIYKIGRGPSSSHTMGPERAARLFLSEHPEADRIEVVLYGSLCKTGVGHGTDRVLREVLQEVDAEIVFSKEDPVGIQHPNTMDFFAYQGPNQTGHIRVESVGGGDIVILGRPADPSAEIYPENSFAEVRDFCKWRYINTLSEYVEMNEGPEIWDFLREVWKAMQQSITDGLSTTGILPGGLNVERKAKQLYENQLPTEVAQVLECRIICAYAYAVSEQNADNGIIVTAPTCGAAGVLPKETPPSPAPNAAARQRWAWPAPWPPAAWQSSTASTWIRWSTPQKSPWSITWASPATPSAAWSRSPASSATPWPPCGP